MAVKLVKIKMSLFWMVLSLKITDYSLKLEQRNDG